jgi:hypothetical protein
MRLPKPTSAIGAPRFELGKWRPFEDDPTRIPLRFAGGLSAEEIVEMRAESESEPALGRDMDAPGLLYAIQPYYPNPRRSDAPVKLGYTTDEATLRTRLASLQTSHWLELRVIWTMPGTRADEQALHKRCADDRIRGEWFHAGHALIETLTALSEAA